MTNTKKIKFNINTVTNQSKMSADLDFLGKYVNQCEVRLDKYHPNKLLHLRTPPEAEDEVRKKFPALQDVPLFTEPRICTWAFISKEEMEELLSCKNLARHRNFLDKKLCGCYPKASPKIILLDLLYSTLKFARTTSLTAEQTATILSMFYLTHRYFACSYRATAEDVYYYMRDMVSAHSLDFIPEYVKIFEPDMAVRICDFFCKVYLRHLPIIRLLTLPNFQFELDLTIEPPPVFKKPKKGKKDKPEKKGKGKKK